MRENNDLDDESGGLNRRNVLRTLGAGGTAAIAGVGQVSALSGEEDLLEKEMVNTLLKELDNPNVVEVTIEDQDLTEDISMEKADIETEVGTLVYAEFDDHDAEPEAYFQVDDLTGGLKRKLPEQYRGLPNNIELFFVYQDGDVVARRTATNPEQKQIAEIVGFTAEEADEMPIIYDTVTGSFETGKIGEGEEEGEQYRIELEEEFAVNEHQKTHKALHSGRYTSEVLELEDKSDDGGPSIMSWEGGDCWGLNFGAPCSQCVFGSGVCGGCAAVCGATGGLGCIPCIAGCAGTGGACGCCLSCNSGVHNPVCY